MAGESLEVDPVCGMRVDPARAVHKTVYRGRVYYFCSRRCRELFERDPERYLRHGPAGMHGGPGKGEG